MRSTAEHGGRVEMSMKGRYYFLPWFLTASMEAAAASGSR